MKNIIVSTELTCDLSYEFLKENDIPAIGMIYTVDGVDYCHDFGKEMEFKEFYDAMRNGANVKTSLINLDRCEKFLEEQLKTGKDVLHLSFASATSGTYDNFKRAAEILNEKYENKAMVVDTMCQAGGQGLMVTLVNEYANEGHSLKECYDYAESLKHRIAHYFVVDDLKYLMRGGRISKTSAILGTILKIKPVLYTNKDGFLMLKEKVMSRKKSLMRLCDKMAERYNGESPTVYISHGDCIDDAKYVANEIYNRMGIECKFLELSPIIGTHSGPGTVALFFTQNNRIDGDK